MPWGRPTVVAAAAAAAFHWSSGSIQRKEKQTAAAIESAVHSLLIAVHDLR